MTIAVSTRSPVIGTRVDPQVTQAVTRIAGLLKDAGHQIQQVDPPYPQTIALKFMRRWLPGIAKDTLGLSTQQLEKRTQSMAAAGRWMQRMGWDRPASDDSFGTNMQHWFKDYDLLLTPTLSEPAIKIGQWRDKGWVMTALGAAKWVFTSPWNLAQFPAASIPVGLSVEGLPIGMQLVTPAGGEDILISMMAEIEGLG